jgi:hypothetical protein
MPELKRKPHVTGQQRQILIEPRQIALECRRKLIQHRSQPPRRAQRFQRLQKQLRKAARVLHFHDVRQPHVRFAGERELAGSRASQPSSVFADGNCRNV